MPYVFICYAHESADFRARVKELADWLTGHGIKVVSDHAHEVVAPEKGWQVWMQHGIEDAAAVLVICTPTLKARHEKREPLKVGLGATFEGVIIGDLLYAACQRNGKVIPVLPDGGDPEDIPVVLRAFYAGLCFPSGYDLILKAIGQVMARTVGEPPPPPIRAMPSPAPTKTFESVPGLLRGADDRRLAPRAGAIYGRDMEIARVLKFLRSTEDGAAVCAQVTGTGGIGKTEVCKAALQRWLKEAPQQRVFYIDVPDSAGADELIYVVGRALGAPNVAGFEELRLQLQEGLYYLDNLEGVAEKPAGLHVLAHLCRQPGVRVLASSRVWLSAELNQTIRIDALPSRDAIRLFRDQWSGSKAPKNLQNLHRFVINDLGCHALSITLTARLGDSYGFSALVQRWKEKGTGIAADLFDSATRQGSLNFSLSLTAERLRSVHAGTLQLWTLAALFFTGMPEQVLTELEQILMLPDQARQLLSRHHVWTLHEGKLHILPPVARYALDEATAKRGGFSWSDTRSALFSLIQKLADQASSKVSTREALAARIQLLERFDAIVRFLETEAAQQQPEHESLERMNWIFLKLHHLRVAQSRELIQMLWPCLIKSAELLRARGNIEVRFGQLQEAQQFYEQALKLEERESCLAGMADTYWCMGKLETRLGHINKARKLYNKSINLYTEEQDDLGQANTSKSLGDLENRIGSLDKARDLYRQALTCYERKQYGIGHSNALKSLGDIESRLDCFVAAQELYALALGGYQSEQFSLGEANTLRALGDIERRLGNLDAARSYFDRALELYEHEHSGLGRANTLKSLGDLEYDRGYREKARSLYEQSLQLCKREQSDLGQGEALQALGNLDRDCGNIPAALTAYKQALTLYAEQGEPEGQTRTCAGLARCYHQLSQRAERDESLLNMLAAARALTLALPSIEALMLDVLTGITGSEQAARDWLAQHPYA